jgi:tetratricopeptide (TPR) repeat protein
VWWVRAEEPVTLATDYGALAEKLEPQQSFQDQDRAVELVRGWLGHNRGWLLIFDNAPSAREVRDYLPHGKTGHVLITSPDPAWRSVAQPLPVKVFDRTDAVDFLLKRTGQKDQNAAGALSEELGCLPLALEQAGAYVETTQKSLPDYLALFRSRQQELLRRGRPATDYPATVGTTWELSFQQVQQISSAGAELLNLCAFLAPDDIPIELVRKGAEYFPPDLAGAVTDELVFDEAVAELRRWSLVELDDDSLSIHRLVQAVIRDRLGENEKKKWAEAAVRFVNRDFPFDSDDVRTWPTCSRLLLHALASAEYAERIGGASDTTSRLLNQVALYLNTRAQFAEAKALLERALKIAEAAYGPNHPNVAIKINNLGLVLKELGDLAGGGSLRPKSP